jgi:hypothetical protein
MSEDNESNAKCKKQQIGIAAEVLTDIAKLSPRDY